MWISYDENNNKYYTNLQYEYLASGSIDVKFTIGRIVWIDALASEEIDDILRTIFIAIGSCHLLVYIWYGMCVFTLLVSINLKWEN